MAPDGKSVIRKFGRLMGFEAREWLARSALNRIREDPELEPATERAFF
jgi:hypothetical protein